jgi:hypothetical protein
LYINIRKQSLKTYEDIEKFIENETRRKDDKKNSIYYETSGLGTKVAKFLKAGSEIIDGSTEKTFVQRLGISTSTYQDIKKRILKEITNERDPKCKVKGLTYSF